MLRYWWHTRVSLVSFISILFVHWLREEDRTPSYGSSRSSRYVNTWNEKAPHLGRPTDRGASYRILPPFVFAIRDYVTTMIHDDIYFGICIRVAVALLSKFWILRERIFRRTACTTVPIMTVERSQMFRRHRKPVLSKSGPSGGRRKIFRFFFFYLDLVIKVKYFFFLFFLPD